MKIPKCKNRKITLGEKKVTINNHVWSYKYPTKTIKSQGGRAEHLKVLSTDLIEYCMMCGYEKV